jgi:glutamyl-tRNA reductase
MHMPDGSSRKAVPLSPLELDALQRLREAGTPQHQLLVDIAGPRAVKSEATVLQALVQLGLQRIDELLLDRAYERMAAEPSEEDLQYGEAIRKRRARRSETSA